MDKSRSGSSHFLSSRCYFANFLSQVTTLTDRLDENDKEVLKAANVWSILQAPRVPQNIPLLYCLVSCYNLSRDNFSLGSKEISFTPNDVALIMGLPNHGEEVAFQLKPYATKTKTSLKNELLEMDKRRQNINLKSIFLHMLCNLFFPSSLDRIPQQFEDMAEPQVFMKYNWAKAIHFFLMSSVRATAGKLPPNNQIEKRSQTSLGYVYGCTHALIIWFLEHTTNILPVFPQCRPRLLRWSDKATFNLKSLVSNVPAMSDVQVLDEMEDVTPEELELCSDVADQPSILQSKRKLLALIPPRQKRFKMLEVPVQPSPPPKDATAPYKIEQPPSSPREQPPPPSYEKALVNLERRMLARINDMERKLFAYINLVDKKLDLLSDRVVELCNRPRPSSSVHTSPTDKELAIVDIKESPFKLVKRTNEKEQDLDAYTEEYPSKMLLTQHQREFIEYRMRNIPSKNHITFKGWNIIGFRDTMEELLSSGYVSDCHIDAYAKFLELCREKDQKICRSFLYVSPDLWKIDVAFCDSMMLPQCKKRRMCNEDDHAFLPTSLSPEYFVEPSLTELAARESIDPGYCSRVPNFVIGRAGYGYIKFLGETDVRWLDLQKLVKIDRNSVTVYENEIDKPPIGEGLNKTAEVTLILPLRLADSHDLESSEITAKLRKCSDRQGAKFLSFDHSSGEWKFLVHHFSRFGLGDEEEDVMDIQPTGDDHERLSGEIVLSHSLPAHLGLDPIKMQEMRMLMFPVEEEDELIDGSFFLGKTTSGREFVREKSPSSSARGSAYRSSLEGSAKKAVNRISTSPLKNPPLPLLEYNIGISDVSPSRGILMTGQNKGLPLRTKKAEGFKLEEKFATPLSGRFSSYIVDAALFMGRSFRVGWGPNGVLVHTGTPVGKTRTGLSSIIHVEKIAIDGVVRDEQNKVKQDLVDFCFSFPLNLHKSLDHETVEVKVDTHMLKLHKIISNRAMLPEICRAYIGIIEKQLELPGLSMPTRVLLMHQVTVWELMKVLFSERETNGNFRSSSDDVGEDMVLDKKDFSLNIDVKANPLVRRAEFSYWLQDSVCHRIQVDVSSLNDSKYLENILVLLTGRQLDAAVELAASKGDVRLAILLSQAGGSMVSRADMARQLDLWKVNGMDFRYIEKERLKLYELLAGNILGALQDSTVDWKRHLGLVMWYQLPPDTQLPVVINTYEQLLNEGRAPHPVPVYVDEGPIIDRVDWSSGDRYDIAYYFMLLHANVEKDSGFLKSMFSAFSSTFDPLDYHMIWHQRVILESIGAFSSNDLHLVDLSFVSQLLCVGLCHWAIYVVVHMPYYNESPHIHASLIKEILLQYCETWSTKEAQQQFIADLGVPSAWMHEALATYHQYYGNLQEALEHFLECAMWQKAHSIFMTSVVHPLFLSSKHSEIWRITSIMEQHKSEIADWDIGAGIFIDFYVIRSSLQEEITLSESDILAEKNEECRNFFSRLNQSLRVWGSRFPIDARVTYSRMTEEVCDLLQSFPGKGSSPSVLMGCFETMLNAPIPQDLRAGHLQEALSVFTYILAQSAS